MEQCLGNHPLVTEDFLGAGAVENWLQDCAEPSEIFCE